MNEVVKIKVNVYNQELFIKKMLALNVNIWNITYQNRMLTCNVNNKDLNKIKKIYQVAIVKEYTFKRYKKVLKINMINIITLVWIVLLFLFLSNVIVNVNIESDNQELVQDLTKELNNYGIKRLTIKKNYGEINNIKNILKNKFNNRLEWLEIENSGMKYIVKLEMRKSKVPKIEAEHCHVVAATDGLITRIKAATGIVMVKSNQFVKEGDILISGNISVNDETKKDVCSNGLVYGEKWYSVFVDIPNTYEEKEYTGKKKHNLLIEWDNRDFKIFKSRYNNYDTSKNLVISILGKKLYSLTEYEYKYSTKTYEDDNLDFKIDSLVVEKLNLSLNDDEKILYKNILKKEVNDSRIRVELFVAVEKLISKQITY
jgi:similar to stage IV sporulation protein